MKNNTSLREIIKTDGADQSLEMYKQQAKDIMIQIFQLDTDEKQIPLHAYLANGDHWAEHTYHVYKKSLEIKKRIKNALDVEADEKLLYIMSWMHDSGRFRLPIPKASDTPNQTASKLKKQKKSESEHFRYGVAQVKLWIKKLKEQNIVVSDQDQKKIEDYILNHDFFNERLDGTKYQEPQSIEWQITRLSDRISVPIEEEIQRYRETGKRLHTPYFKNDISREERAEFNFSNMWKYIKTWKFDEFTFFLALLSQKPSDFSNPVLAKIYQGWSSTKHKWIERILQIAKEEGYNEKEIVAMQQLIAKYLQHFDIQF